MSEALLNAHITPRDYDLGRHTAAALRLLSLVAALGLAIWAS